MPNHSQMMISDMQIITLYSNNMKATPKRFSYSAINLVTMMLMGIMYTSCTTNCDDCPMEKTIHPRMAIELTLEANTANMATAMNAVYTDMLTDSLKRVKFAKALLDSTRYLNHNQGYFFLVSLSEYNIVDAAYPQIEGEFLGDWKDQQGHYYVTQVLQRTQMSGQGWTAYLWQDPENKKVEQKYAYYKHIPAAGWAAGSGYYESMVGEMSDLTYDQFLGFQYRELTNSMAQAISNVSRVYAGDSDFFIKALRKMIHFTRFGAQYGGYFFVLDMEGTVMAHGADPSLVGKNLWNFKDEKGTLIIQELVSLIKANGGGRADYYWKNVVDQQVELKHGYVKAIAGTNMLIGSGFFE